MRLLLEAIFIWPYQAYWAIANFFSERWGYTGPMGGDRTLKPVLGSLLIYADLGCLIAGLLTQANGWWIANVVLSIAFIVLSFIPMPEPEIANVEDNYFPRS